MKHHKYESCNKFQLIINFDVDDLEANFLNPAVKSKIIKAFKDAELSNDEKKLNTVLNQSEATTHYRMESNA